MLETILKILLVIFGGFTGLLFTLPLLIGMFESEKNYIPFGIGTILGIIGAFILAYALRFHT